MQLAQYLATNKLTLTDFGGQIGRSAATVSRIVRGIQKPDWDTLDRIAEATDGAVMPNDFITPNLDKAV